MAPSHKTLNSLAGRSILIIAFLALASSIQARAEGSGDVFSEPDDKKVAKLEEKFFQHPYPKDEAQARLERLEKLIFGSTQTGDSKERLAALWKAVPNIDTQSTADSTAAKTEASSDSGTSHKSKASSAASKGESKESASEGSQYPSVTAMERKSLGKDYVGDPINQRLDRLETKTFGRPSTSTDLSERVDRLKQRTGIDIARAAPVGSDWADEDDNDVMPPMPTSPVSSDSTTAKVGEDGMSFSGRDLRSDMRKAFGGMTGAKSYSGSGASGSYGMKNYSSSSSGVSSGAYGFGGGGSSSTIEPDIDDIAEALPPAAPVRQQRANPVPDQHVASMGLSQQVTALETEIFGKSFSHDPLPARVSKLEATVFPQQKASADQPLPDRVQRLLAAVPISEHHTHSKNKHADADSDLADLGAGQTVQTQQSHGLGKVISSLGNFFSGGAIGGYPMQTGGFATDPRTGMLVDQYTGNLIDPNTGAVVGTRTPVYGGYNPGFGLGNYGGFGGFNNGFSPFGSPYGMGSGVRFGMGGGRLGGMWP